MNIEPGRSAALGRGLALDQLQLAGIKAGRFLRHGRVEKLERLLSEVARVHGQRGQRRRLEAAEVDAVEADDGVLLLTKRIAPRAGKRKKPGTRVLTAVPGSGVKETKPRTIIIQAQKGNVNYERDNENQQNRRIP